METTIYGSGFRDIRLILGFYGDNGKLNGNDYLGFTGVIQGLCTFVFRLCRPMINKPPPFKGHDDSDRYSNPY